MTVLLPCPEICTPWCVPEDITGAAAALDQTSKQQACDVATFILYEVTRRRWPGVCSDSVRPCAREFRSDHGRPVRGYQEGWFSSGPGWFGGNYSAWGACDCNRSDRTGCNRVSEVQLEASIGDVTLVTIDGVVLPKLDPDSGWPNWRISDDRYLLRMAGPDGSNPGWPCCQRMDLPLTEVGTWGIDYVYGDMPPQAGKTAAAALAGELALSVSPDRSQCSLPRRVTSITRNGMTAVVNDPNVFVAQGKADTGIFLVNQFINAANQEGDNTRAIAISPDTRVRRNTRQR